MKEVSIIDYGARISDALQTRAIQSAIDDCFLAGGGKVVIPCGIFLTGGLRLRSNVTLYLEAGAILKGSLLPDDYEGFLNDALEPVEKEDFSDGRHPYTYITSTWNYGLIHAIGAENIAIIGEKGSYLDGSNVYDSRGEEGYRGPHAISLWGCKNIRLEGYTVINSSNWAHAIFYSQDVLVRGVSAYGGHDGVDIRSCDRVRIENCTLRTGDDSIAGYDNHDVVVSGCNISSACNTFRLGGNNILIENCTATGPCSFGYRGHLSDEKKIASAITDESCRHKAMNTFRYFCDYRIKIRKVPGNIVLRNCVLGSTNRIFQMDFGVHKWCCNKMLRSITFEDCYFPDLKLEGLLLGEEATPFEFTMRRCRFGKEEDAEPFPLLRFRHFKSIHLEDLTFDNIPEPKIVLESDGKIEVLRSEGLEVIRQS